MPPTKMTSLSDRLRRLALLSLLACLAACGPGTGGTGTGPVQGVLNFSGTSVPGVLPSGLQCQGGCDEVRLTLEPQRVELTAACRRFVHTGDWLLGADGKAAVEGQVETTTSAGTAVATATLQLQFSGPGADSPQVTVLLAGEGGAVLAGPALLQRGEAPAAAAPVECRP
jgi:hypothetical protein